jgi:hypothetical protein
MEGWILTPEVGLWLALDGCPAAGRKGIAWIAAISELLFTSRYSSSFLLLLRVVLRFLLRSVERKEGCIKTIT